MDNIAIRLFRYPGTSLYIAPEILLYDWFNNLPGEINYYYAFWGSYLDLKTGKEFPNVIELQAAGIFGEITRSQVSIKVEKFPRQIENNTRQKKNYAINIFFQLFHQMNAFRSLLNVKFKKLETVAPLKKQVQPVYYAKGFYETLRIF